MALGRAGGPLSRAQYDLGADPASTPRGGGDPGRNADPSPRRSLFPSTDRAVPQCPPVFTHTLTHRGVSGDAGRPTDAEGLGVAPPPGAPTPPGPAVRPAG